VGGRVSTPIEVSELRLSAVARIELVDIQPTLPCFKAVSVCFMKRPSVDFSLKVARLDIMNIGPSDYNVTAIVRNLLQSALVDGLTYPRRMLIPMTDSSTAEYYTLHPVGILYITFIRGMHLKQANVFGSDPYCIARSMQQQEVRTSVKYYSLNPVWEETHDIMVYDKALQEVNIEVSYCFRDALFECGIWLAY